MTVYSELRARANEAWQTVETPPRPRIAVGITTCSRAKGADDTLAAIRREVAQRNLAVDVVVTGCWGLCYAEPMLEIAKPSGQRVLYQQVTADRVPQLIDEALDGEGVCGVLALGVGRADAGAGPPFLRIASTASRFRPGASWPTAA